MQTFKLLLLAIIMSISIKTFSLKCLKNTLSLYTRSSNLHPTTTSFNIWNPVNYIALQNIKLYSSSPISWDDVDSITANNINEPKKESGLLKTKGMLYYNL